MLLLRELEDPAVQLVQRPPDTLNWPAAQGEQVLLLEALEYPAEQLEQRPPATALKVPGAQAKQADPFTLEDPALQALQLAPEIFRPEGQGRQDGMEVSQR